MTRTQRSLLYVGSGIAAGLLVSFIVITAMTRTEFGMERARGFAAGWLADRVDGVVHIGSIGGRGLLGGVTLRDFYIIDKKGRPFVRIDSATVGYDWRTLVRGQIVIDNATLYGAELYFEQLPGDTVWNFQHIFKSPDEPGAVADIRRLIMFTDARVVDGSAVVRIPYESPAEASTDARVVLDTLPGGVAQVMRFDSLYGTLSRVVWESPSEAGKLFDVRSMAGRSYVWREPMHVRDVRGTVTLVDSVVSFDMPLVRLPASNGSVVGRVIAETGRNFFDVRVELPRFTLRDLHWLYPRLPESGGGSGTLLMQSQRPAGTLWLVKNARIAAPGTRLAGDFGIVTGADSLYFTNVDLRASPLNLELVQQIVPQRLPLDGLLVGTVEIKGGLSALDTRGDVRLGGSSVRWAGTVDVNGGFGARNLRADLNGLDLALLKALNPALALRGRVTGRVEASGSFNRSITFAADIHHVLSGFTSSFDGGGTWTGGAKRMLDVELNARPLSLSELAQSYPALQRLRGDARGPIRLRGPLDDLAVHADLETQGGRAIIDGRLTHRSSPRYTGTATLHSFRLHDLIADLPDATLDGRLTFDVAGRGVADATGRVTAHLARGTIQTFDFTDLHTAMTLEAGTARVDSLRSETRFGSISVDGTFGLLAEKHGTLAFALRNDTTTGRVRATGSVRGNPHDFDLSANLEITALNAGGVLGDRVSARLTGSRAGFELTGRADSVVGFGKRADTATVFLRYAGGSGEARVHAAAASGDEYNAHAGITRDGQGLVLALRGVELGHRDAPWQLNRQTRLRFDERGIHADSVEVRRGDGGRVRAAGTIAWADPGADARAAASDFRLDFEGVPFTEFARITLGASGLNGVLSGNVRVSGSAFAPVFEADATVNAFAIAEARLDRVTGSFTYADRFIRARINGEKAGRRVLFADGSIPFNLALTPVDDRSIDQNLRFSLHADSLPATFFTPFVEGFSNVAGRIDGTLLATGTTRRPQLGGSLALRDGNASWLATGVRYRDLNGTIRLEGERTARVNAEGRANGGRAQVAGTIDFRVPRDPAFELTLDAQNFLAAKRRDAEFTASGRVALGGRFRAPVVTGAVAVERGALFLDELYRRFQIVELEDPLLYDVVDTSLVALPTILRTQNPFIKNLVVRDLRVAVGRESWLRSRDLNVEVVGDLNVAFLLADTLGPRSAEDLRLTGTLRAERGTYQLAGPGLSRRFAIRDGTIEFPGTPGVDPGLAFNAAYRVRSPRRDLIDIIAVVGGTLRNPRIRLTSDDEGVISESDLASYLFFGVPTYELTASQSAAVSQARAGFSPEVLGFAASSGFGFLANSLQTFAQNVGLLDYVSLTAAEVGIRQESAIASLFAGTRLELGRYVGRDGNVYIAYSQSLTAQGHRAPGVRLEWQLMPTLTGEFFVEDRFARTPDFGSQNIASKRVYGLFVFREWSY